MPYLAVIIDSFRAALASKVLWFAFVTIWLLVIALAPIGIDEGYTTEITGFDIYNPTQLKYQLADGLDSQQDTDRAIARIAAALPEEVQETLGEVLENPEKRISVDPMRSALNELITAEEFPPDWHEAEAWKSLRETGERLLLEERQDSLNTDEQQRLKRLWIESAIPGVFAPRNNQSAYLTYAWLKFPYPVPVSKARFANLINDFVLPLLISWMLGFIFVLLGIVVTAPIIPGMLQPGSLHLLLSKPISRSGLLISKFVGGCSFMLICVSQLALGMFLVLGFRLDVWSTGLLWCIPASLFLFAVFYSVSVMAGLAFRSEVVSIGVTCLFGGICFVVNFGGNIFDDLITSPQRITLMRAGGQEYFAQNAGGQLNRWDASSKEWVTMIATNPFGMDLVIPPVTVADSDGSTRVITAKVTNGRVNPMAGGNVQLQVFEPEGWESVPTVKLPLGTSSLTPVGDEYLVASHSTGLSAIEIEKALISPDETARKDPDAKKENKMAGFFRSLAGGGARSEDFKVIAGVEIQAYPPLRLAGTNQGNLLFASRDRIYRLQPRDNDDDKDADNDLWAITAEGTLPGEGADRFVWAVGDQYLLFVRRDQPLHVMSLETLEVVGEIEVDDSFQGTHAAAVNGKFYVADAEGDLYEVNESGGQWSLVPTSFGTVESIVASADGQELLVAHHVDRVDALTAEGRVNRLSPQRSFWRRINDYAVTPLRYVIPQTGELGEVVGTMIRGRSAVVVGGNVPGQEAVVERSNLVRPLVSCGGFIFVMMAINVWYFRSRDF
ncbi:MAG: ABC transporter permease [Planctomycetota bacterium]